MNKNNDIILIKETDSEYIDKIIIILNENKKNMIPEDIIIKQAENIIFEYQYKNSPENNTSQKRIKIFKFSTACFMFISVIFLLIKNFI